MGLTAKNEALYLVNRVESGEFFWLDTKNGKRLRTATSVDYYFIDVNISSDGKFLFATQNPRHKTKGKLGYNDLFIINAETLSKVKQISTTARSSIGHPVPFGGNLNKVTAPVLEFTWDKELQDFAGDPDRGGRIEVWDWKTGKREKAIRYSHAPGAAEIAFSPDQKYLACFFKEITSRHKDAGILDFVDPASGKILWHIEGSSKQSLRLPYTFLSSTQLACGNAIYNIKTRKVEPLFTTSDHKFIGSVPEHAGKLLVLTPDGLELMDWATKRTLHKWPSIKEGDEVRFSPDLTIMAVENDTKHTCGFYRFDANWLK